MTKFESELSESISLAEKIVFMPPSGNNGELFLLIFGSKLAAEKCAYLLSELVSEFSNPASLHLTITPENKCELLLLVTAIQVVEGAFIKTVLDCDAENILSSKDDDNIDAYNSPELGCAHFLEDEILQVNQDFFKSLTVLPVVSSS